MLFKRMPRILAFVCLTALLLAGLSAPAAEAASPGPAQAVFTREDLVVLYADGTAAATGKDPAIAADAADWKDVTAISAADGALLGLRKDGTLCGGALAAFPEAAEWKNVVYAASTGTHLLALEKDGTVLCAGPEHFGTRERYSFSDWKRVSRLTVGRSGAGEYAVGLMEDGSVRNDFLPGKRVGKAGKTAEVSCSGYLLLCLRRDGTVTAAGQDAAALGEEIIGWTDVTQVCAGDSLAVALKKDGTVLAASTWDTELVEALSAWRDVRALTLAPGNLVFGLMKDGGVCVEPKSRARFGARAVEGWSGVERILCADERRVAAVSTSGELLTAGTDIPGAAAPARPSKVTDSQGRSVESVMQSYGAPADGAGAALRWDEQGRVTEMIYSRTDDSRGVFSWRYDNLGRLTDYRMEASESLPVAQGEIFDEIDHSITLSYASDGGVTAELRRFVASGGGELEHFIADFDGEGRLVRLVNYKRSLPGPGEPARVVKEDYRFARDGDGELVSRTLTRGGKRVLEEDVPPSDAYWRGSLTLDDILHNG